jgi:hypothetical protein
MAVSLVGRQSIAPDPPTETGKNCPPMLSLPQTPDLLALAERTVWFEEPAPALSPAERFIGYILTWGTYEDVKVLRQYVNDDGLREALDHAPPGVFDGPSWAYWNLKLGRYAAAPMPPRRFDMRTSQWRE